MMPLQEQLAWRLHDKQTCRKIKCVGSLNIHSAAALGNSPSDVVWPSVLSKDTSHSGMRSSCA